MFGSVLTDGCFFDRSVDDVHGRRQLRVVGRTRPVRVQYRRKFASVAGFSSLVIRTRDGTHPTGVIIRFVHARGTFRGANGTLKPPSIDTKQYRVRANG